ncbi:MAG: lamin tail domain-containing protein [Bacillota bacterium]
MVTSNSTVDSLLRKACARVVSRILGAIRSNRIDRRPRGGPIEPLEVRTLLSSPYISEFMASNATTLADQDDDYPDWIEIANPNTTAINLDGYYLTDDATTLDKWRIPSLEISGGGFATIFASGKDQSTAGQQLHTNFQLDSVGEYLALVAPDGKTVLSDYSPQFPSQLSDISYGISSDVEITSLLTPNSPARAWIPVDGSLGTTWINPNFNDSNWISGTTGLGFDTDVAPVRMPGFTVRMVNVTGAITDISTAQRILDDPRHAGYPTIEDLATDYPVVNHGIGGDFYPDELLPNGLSTDEEYVLRATADVVIPAGTWTIAVGSDDGFMLRIPGVTFTNRYNENPGGSASDTLMFSTPRGHAQTYASFTVPAGGLSTTLTLDFYENGGGDDVELSIASGQQTFDGSFVLLSDGVLPGWSVKTTSSSPPIDYRSILGTNLQPAMFNHNASAYIRIPLRQGIVPEDFDKLRLRIKYDDGFVAYLNGQEIARRNAPSTLKWNSAATAEHSDRDALIYDEIQIDLPPGLLRGGSETNILAIQGLNSSATDGDFLIYPELLGVHTLASAERYFTNPTPGAINDSSSLTSIVADTKFSRDRGFYDTPFLLTITCDTPGAEIRYTLDGSAPTATTGLVYTDPITISRTTVLRAAAFKPGSIASNVDTETYVFLSDVIRQSSNPDGFPATGTAGVHWDYGMDPEVVDAYGNQLIDGLKAIPSVSLVMDTDDVFGPTGIYANPESTGVAWERPGSAELMFPDGSQDGFQIDAGVRIYGGVNRNTGFPKHTFRLLFKNQYGASKLKYPLFEGTVGGENATDEFDTLVLRGAFNNSWPFWVDSERQRAQYVEDPFMYTTQLAMGDPSIHGRYIHLYVNGLYWGLYNIVERPSASFGASYLGGDKEDYDALNSSEPIDGTKDAWNTLQSLVSADVATPEVYAQVKQYLNVDDFIDYMILNFYGGNQDWDDHNWYALRKREDGAGYYFVDWDGERTLEDPNANVTYVNQYDKPSYIYARLCANAEFRLRFADRVYQHLFNNGPLTPQAATDRYLSLANQIRDAIIGESARWGDYQRQTPYTRDVEWLAEQNRLLTQYFPVRTQNVLDQFKARGLFPNINPPTLSQFGGAVPIGYSLTMTTSSGTIYYTLNGSDPRREGGAVAPGALTYKSPIRLNGPTVVKSRVLAADGTWSALSEANFYHDLSALRISEIMYNPAAPATGPYLAQDYEFIELQNTGSASLDLTGVGFTTGVSFTFPDGTHLAPGQRAVLVKNKDAFLSRYPGVSVAGVFTGSLDNNGERLVLSGPGGTVLDFEHKDGWYSITDGGGYSLVAVNPAAAPADYGQKSNWRPSNTLGGAPGAADPGVNPESIVISEVMTRTASSDGNWIELYNTTDNPIDISGWFLSNSDNNLQKYQIDAGTVLQPHGFLILMERAQFGNPLASGTRVSFGLNPLGGDVYLSNPDGLGGVGGYREHVDFGVAAPEVTFGRYLKSTGGADFVPMSAPTRGALNALPLVGPVVISELMYHSAGGPEFIELLNVTGAELPLFDPNHPENTWKFTEGVEYAFPAGTKLPAFGYALVVPIDPAQFRTLYSIPANVPIFGPYTGALNDAGENVKLARPGAPEATGVPYITVDQVNFSDHAPWPVAADGGGASLSKRNPADYGNDAANWIAGPFGGTPGSPFLPPAPPTLLTATGLSSSSVRLIWHDNSNSEDGFRIERSQDGIHFTQIGVTAPNATTYTDVGLQSGIFYTYRVRAFNGASTSDYSNEFTISTPGVQTFDLIGITDTWQYYQTQQDPGPDWIKPTYDDHAAPWLQGPGLFYWEDASLPAPKGTELDRGPAGNRTPTFYFRKHFTLDVDPATLSEVVIRVIVDDGMVVYLNGDPIPAFALGVDTTQPIDYSTWANRTIGDATYEGPFVIPASKLVKGDNVIAVMAKQVNITSSDVAFGMTLSVTRAVQALAADIAPITPDPRSEPVNSMSIRFPEPVTGFDLNDLVLTRNGSANLLTSQQTLTSTDGRTWTLGNLASLTNIAGDYTLQLRANGSSITAFNSARSLSADAIQTFRITSTVLNGTSADDRYYLRVNGSNLEIFTTIPPTGSPTYVTPLSLLQSLRITGGSGDDILQIAGSLPFVPTIDLGAGADTLILDAGEHTFTGNLSTTWGVDRLAVGGAARVSFAASEQLQSLSLSGTASATLTTSDDHALLVGALDIRDNATLDLNAHGLIVRGMSAADVSKLVQSSLHGAAGVWKGPGLTSSLAQANTLMGLAVLPNDDGLGLPLKTTFMGQSLLATDVLVQCSWNGDVNLDGTVDGDDYFLVDSGFIAQRSGYHNGDLNYNGIIDGDDYFLIDSAFISQPARLASVPPLPTAPSSDALQSHASSPNDGTPTVLQQLFSTQPIL